MIINHTPYAVHTTSTPEDGHIDARNM